MDRRAAIGRRGRWTVLGSLICVVGLAGWLFLMPAGRSFDRAVWHDQSKVSSGVRHAMAKRLVSQETLIGMTRQQVVAMLGAPEERSYEGQLAYELGTYHGVDPQLLIVRLDGEAKVTACWIMTT